MYKEFILYEEALLLKGLGYDEETLHYWLYRDNGTIPTIPTYSAKHMFGAKWNQYPSSLRISAPFYRQVFRWFREKYMLMSVIKVGFGATTWYDYSIQDIDTDEDAESNALYIQSEITYTSYEEAELDCLKKLIEIVKNK